MLVWVLRGSTLTERKCGGLAPAHSAVDQQHTNVAQPEYLIYYLMHYLCNVRCKGTPRQLPHASARN
jgi:hypothetical protein